MARPPAPNDFDGAPELTQPQHGVAQAQTRHHDGRMRAILMRGGEAIRNLKGRNTARRAAPGLAASALPSDPQTGPGVSQALSGYAEPVRGGGLRRMVQRWPKLHVAPQEEASPVVDSRQTDANLVPIVPIAGAMAAIARREQEAHGDASAQPALSGTASSDSTAWRSLDDGLLSPSTSVASHANSVQSPPQRFRPDYPPLQGGPSPYAGKFANRIWIDDESQRSASSSSKHGNQPLELSTSRESGALDRPHGPTYYGTSDHSKSGSTTNSLDAAWDQIEAKFAEAGPSSPAQSRTSHAGLRSQQGSLPRTPSRSDHSHATDRYADADTEFQGTPSWLSGHSLPSSSAVVPPQGTVQQRYEGTDEHAIPAWFPQNGSPREKVDSIQAQLSGLHEELAQMLPTIPEGSVGRFKLAAHVAGHRQARVASHGPATAGSQDELSASAQSASTISIHESSIAASQVLGDQQEQAAPKWATQDAVAATQPEPASTATAPGISDKSAPIEKKSDDWVEVSDAHVPEEKTLSPTETRMLLQQQVNRAQDISIRAQNGGASITPSQSQAEPALAESHNPAAAGQASRAGSVAATTLSPQQDIEQVGLELKTALHKAIDLCKSEPHSALLQSTQSPSANLIWLVVEALAKTERAEQAAPETHEKTAPATTSAEPMSLADRVAQASSIHLAPQARKDPARWLASLSAPRVEQGLASRTLMIEQAQEAADFELDISERHLPPKHAVTFFEGSVRKQTVNSPSTGSDQAPHEK